MVFGEYIAPMLTVHFEDFATRSHSLASADFATRSPSLAGFVDFATRWSYVGDQFHTGRSVAFSLSCGCECFEKLICSESSRNFEASWPDFAALDQDAERASGICDKSLQFVHGTRMVRNQYGIPNGRSCRASTGGDDPWANGIYHGLSCSLCTPTWPGKQVERLYPKGSMQH